MRRLTAVFLLFLTILSSEPQAQTVLEVKVSGLPEIPSVTKRPSTDWVIDGSPFVSKVARSADGKDIILTNGLVSRVFRIYPNLSTTNIINHMTGETLVRTACPEGTVTIDGKDYPLGGLDGIEEYGYLTEEWLDGFSLHSAEQKRGPETGS